MVVLVLIALCSCCVIVCFFAGDTYESVYRLNFSWLLPLYEQKEVPKNILREKVVEKNWLREKCQLKLNSESEDSSIFF